MKHLSPFDKYKNTKVPLNNRIDNVEKIFDLLVSFYDAGDYQKLIEKIIQLNQLLNIKIKLPQNDNEMNILLKCIEDNPEIDRLFKGYKSSNLPHTEILNQIKKALLDCNDDYLLKTNPKLKKADDIGVFDKS